MRETKINNSALFFLGYVGTRELWRHMPGVFLVEIEQQLTEAGGTYGCHKLDTGEWAFGWLFSDALAVVDATPSPSRVRLSTVLIPSDSRPGQEYHVRVDITNGVPISCTCPAGQNGVLCKHLYRGQVRACGTLIQAAREIVKKGDARSLAHFWQRFEATIEKTDENRAIEKTIRLGLGEDHSHATDWKTLEKARRAERRAKEEAERG